MAEEEQQTEAALALAAEAAAAAEAAIQAPPMAEGVPELSLGRLPPEAATATHMLLYLSKETFVGAAGDRLADEVRAARAAKLPVLLLHEKNSCEFGRFFQTTPQDLIADGVYKMVALEMLPAPHDAERRAPRAGGGRRPCSARRRRTSCEARSHAGDVHEQDCARGLRELTSPISDVHDACAMWCWWEYGVRARSWCGVTVVLSCVRVFNY